MILYKYVRPKRIDILHSGLIAFSDPRTFNDPFEVSPVFAADDPEAIELAKLKTGDDAVDRPIQKRIDKLQDDHGMKRLVYENATNIIGVLSLSAVPDSILMWAHYTAQHTGFVIGFDTGHPSWLKMQESQDVGRPINVTYASKRPSPPSMNDVTADQVWYTKSHVWAYEQEWRITRLIGLPWRRAQLRQPKVPLYPFPKEAIAKVIVGCRASAALDLEVNQLRLEVPEYRNYEVFRAEPDEKQFKINLVR